MKIKKVYIILLSLWAAFCVYALVVSRLYPDGRDTSHNWYADSYVALCAKIYPEYIEDVFNLDANDLLSQDPQYVALHGIEKNTLVLNDDGTGAITTEAYGEQNIRKWSVFVERGVINIHTSDLSYTGTIAGDKIELGTARGFALCFFKDGANNSAVTPLTEDEYRNIVFGITDSQPQSLQQEATVISPVGEYELTAVKTKGLKVSPSHFKVSSSATLNDDGTGVVMINGSTMQISSWMVSGENIFIDIPEQGSYSGTFNENSISIDATGDKSYYAVFTKNNTTDYSGVVS